MAVAGNRRQPRAGLLGPWTDLERAWLAGLMEGEGCFSRKTDRSYVLPTVTLAMTDKDVVERAAALFRANVRLGHTERGNKQLYQLAFGGARAVQAMQRLRPLLGERRSARINEIVTEYYAARPHLEVIPE